MASNFVSSIFVLAAITFSTVTLAKEFIVGDEAGWTLGFDYQAWAHGKGFRVGDKLVFKYPIGLHNVLPVNETGFQHCIRAPTNEALTSGNDTIYLRRPGRKWYICGVGKHCEHGLKLSIIVRPAKPKAPPTSRVAKKFVVGDGAGWRLGFDYKTWVKDKDFRVGDKLIFRYPVGVHNVFRVNGTEFENCVEPPASKALSTGHDTIVLASAGKKWYICGVEKHCEHGMKLAIRVKPARC